MRTKYQPKMVYEHSIPMFDSDGRVTSRVLTGLENVLEANSLLAESIEKSGRKRSDISVKEVYILGSGADRNRIDSDMDLGIIMDNIDEELRKRLKMVFTFAFYCNREKSEAVDVYPLIGKESLEPGRPAINITDQVKHLIDEYNDILMRT